MAHILVLHGQPWSSAATLSDQLGVTDEIFSDAVVITDLIVFARDLATSGSCQELELCHCQPVLVFDASTNFVVEPAIPVVVLAILVDVEFGGSIAERKSLVNMDSFSLH